MLEAIGSYWPVPTGSAVNGKRILLIIGGGIAAYKCLDLIRRLRERGVSVRTIMTHAATQFITPLAVGALTNERVFTELFDLNDEREIGHIRLSRETDLIVVAPATADLLAKMANGHANDLATCVLLATNKPVLVAPAMNPRMWSHAATQRNVAQLKADGIGVIEPRVGEMAESGEAGTGRLPDTADLVAAIEVALSGAAHALTGCHVLVTSGPTHEPIDPVRYIANRSSGKQGHAIAAAAARAGARVTLVSGPVSIPDPAGVSVVRVETAAQMLDAVQAALPADIAIFAAAVADWRTAGVAAEKIKKAKGTTGKSIDLVENADILKTVGIMSSGRPRLVIGFAAETRDIEVHAKAKLASKGADWIVANDVSHASGIGGSATGVMGGDHNVVQVITRNGSTTWPELSKQAVAERLIALAIVELGAK
jgi:phosphopantothenoylcysteine decarboxylase / phosphopantothenate---cysteine ligase